MLAVGNEVPLDIALPEVFVNLVPIPVNKCLNDSFNSVQMYTLNWAFARNKTTKCVSRQ